MVTTPMDRARPLARPLACSTALALALLAFAGAAPAQELARTPGDELAAPADDARADERDRVLTLTSGDRLRGRSRWVAEPDAPDGGRWELRGEGGWRALRAGSVASWRDTKELLREADRLAREVRVGEHDRRVALAQWMVAQGLEEEAVAQLDRVLRAEPDHDPALNLIARGAFARPDAVDERRDAEAARAMLLRAGLDASPTRRELAIRELARLEDQAALRAALLEELVAWRHQQRSFAAQALKRLAPGEELRPLLERAVLDRSGEVRRDAALALRASGQEAVVLPLVRALGSENGLVRTNAAESLGNVGFEAAVPALVAHMASVAQGTSSHRPPAGNITVTNQVSYVGDYDVEIAQGASIADPVVNVVTEGVVLDGRAYGFVEYSRVTELVTVRRALKQLTGHDAGRSPDKWQAWYEANRGRFAPRDDREDG